MISELENDAYTVGWICDHENRVTAQTMLDEEHGKPQTREPSDDNSYLLGKVGHHNLVIACLPVRGISSAAIVASKMLSSFRKIRVSLLVGTGGGIPSDDFDIRLGDVAVSVPDRTFGGVVQFDMGKATHSGFSRTGSLNKPPTALLTVIGDLRATNQLRGSKIPEYLTQMLENYPRLAERYVYQGRENDRLFQADYLHKDEQDRSCKKCRRKGIERLIRDTDPVIHYGTIASSNKIIEDSSIRDWLRDEFGAICAETEAAGLMDNFPCVVIRGICNYADSHWRGAERWRQLEKSFKDLSLLIYSRTEIASLKQKTFIYNLPTVSGAAYDSHTKETTSRCYPGTRVDLLRQVRDWANNPDGKRIFWLSGSAGTGKSTISRTLAHSFHEDNQLEASFFFKKGEAGRADAAGLFSTIASQLAINIPATARYIQRAVEAAPSIADKMLREQFNMLIVQPTLRVFEKAPFDSPRVIVLDALDECSSQDMEAILWTFRDAELTADTLRLFVTSRPDIQVLRGFRGLLNNTYQDIVLQNIPEETTKSDLRIYLRHKLADIRKYHNNTISSSRERLPSDWPGRENISILVDMAVPLFIFAATTCRFISDPRHDPNDQLATILKYRTASQKLHQAYLPVLDQLVGDDLDGQQDIVLRRFHNIVGAIILLFEPLSASHLARLLKVRPDEVYLQVDFLHSVLQIPHDDSPIRLLHLSFRDFLTDSTTRADFRVDEKKRHLSLATQCLERMGALPGLRQDICELKSPGVLAAEIEPEVVGKNVPGDLRYACLYWVNHLVEGDCLICDRDKVHQFLTKHILHWIEVLSLLKSLHKATSYIQKLQGLVVSATRGKKISAFLYDAKRFLLYNFSAIEKAPLQAYSSALIFSPKNSLIRKTFKDCVPNWITQLPNVTKNWSALEQTFEPTSDDAFDGPLSFSPDGTKLASGCQIWDITSGQTISRFGDNHWSSAMFLSNHEQITVAKYQLIARNLNTEQTISIPCPGKPQQVESVTGSGPRLVLLREPRDTKGESTQHLFFNLFYVYNIDTGEVLLSYWLGSWSQMFLSFDGRRIALIGEIVAEGQKTPLFTHTEPAEYPLFANRLEVWSLDNDRRRLFSRDYEDLDYCLTSDFSADGSKIAVLLAGSRVSVIDVNGDYTDKTLDYCDIEDIIYLALSPGGTTLAIGFGSEICLWNLDTDEVNPILEKVMCEAMVFSPNGSKLAIRTASGLIKIFDVRAGSFSSSHEQAYGQGSSDGVVFSPCGTLVASSPRYGCRVSIWDVARKKVVQTELARGTEDDVNCLTFLGFSAQNLFVIVNDFLTVWSIQSGRMGLVHTTKLEFVLSRVTFSNDGSRLAGYDDSQQPMLRILDTKSGQNLVSTRLDAAQGVISAKFSKDGSKLAVGIYGGVAGRTIELRESESLALKEMWFARDVGQVAFSADEKSILYDAAAPCTTAWYPATTLTRDIRSSAETSQGIFISQDRSWILTPNGTRMVYLPAEIRPTEPYASSKFSLKSVSICGNMVAIGHESGRVTIMELDSSGF
ncbi:hypothetical protein ASPCAL11642 [Aspergillus calidoustus]|uniref:NACHT domain-containing protein n=1 Tax=Aspergillus calidoustus TaxID=454130 RepID=A0A0U5GBX7_ASPCI|nr:hypothetical protein ASPCAL11642 [Aspergillus calidoustus]